MGDVRRESDDKTGERKISPSPEPSRVKKGAANLAEDWTGELQEPSCVNKPGTGYGLMDR